MVHLPVFITDLGVILITAAITTLIFKVLKQPVVLGYLVAGFLVSPGVSFMPTVTDLEGVKIWAEIGVIFLLFALGLEFSFRRLMKVGPSASITAIFEIFFMLGVGTLTGYLLGWSPMDSLFLGGILSISSTTIIIRAFEELGMKQRGFVSLVFAALIVEDLVAIFLLVLLSALAASSSFSGSDFLFSTLKLPFFMVLWFVAGIYLLPTLFKVTKKYVNDETTLVLSLGLCLGMVILATSLGFSPALGAFVMGSLIAETKEGRKIEHLLVPVRDLFAAVFFVSVGMQIQLSALQEHFWIIVLLTILTIFGKIFSTTFGALLSGSSLRHSVQAGFSLAQIGEFSFIIATLGLTLKVTSDFLYPVAVAVSAITTFTTPYLIRFSDPFYLWLEKSIPERWLKRVTHSEHSTHPNTGANFFKNFWSECGLTVFFNTILVIAISFASNRYLVPSLATKFGFDSPTAIFSGFITFFLALPFLWAIAGGRKFLKGSLNADFPYAHKIGIVLVRLFAIILLVGLITYLTTGFGATAVLMVIGIPLIFILGNGYAEKVYESMEKRFRRNWNESVEPDQKTPQLAPWNATLVKLTISPVSEFVGCKLIETKMKERFGITVVMIQRGKKTISAPNRDEVLFPLDRLLVLGTDEKIALVQPLIEAAPEAPEEMDSDYQLVSIPLRAESPLVGVTIRDSSIRDLTKGLVVGIERNGERILNPDSSLTLLANDLIWLVADRTRLFALRV